MTVSALVLALLGDFVQCFTAPGYAHFTHFVLAHMTLLGRPHCLTETLRATAWHKLVHWTTPYAFMKRGRWRCTQLSLTLLELLRRRLKLLEELIFVIDDVLVSSATLGSRKLLVLIFPQRSGDKLNVFFTSDLVMTPERLLEFYGARFKIEDASGGLKTVGGMGDFRHSVVLARSNATSR